MIFFNKQSIRKKLLTILMGTVMLSLLFVGGILVYRDINVAREELVVKLTTIAGVLGDSSRAAIVFGDVKRGEEILFSLKEEPQVNFAILANKSGGIFVTYLKDQTVHPNESLPLEKEGHFFNKDYLEVIKFIYLDGVFVGKIYLHSHLEKLHEKNMKTLLAIGSVLLFTLMTVYFITLRLSRIISEPIVSLSSLTERVAHTNDYSLRGGYEASDEIGVLYSAFNDMLSQIQNRDIKLDKTHQQLLHSEKLSATGKLAASLAHELNNPICGIRNVLEILYERGNLSEPHKNHLNMAIREIDRISDLVKNLNDFHRPSSGQRSLTDIHTAINEMLLLVKNRVKKRQIVLILKYGKNIPPISIVPDQFKQVILNLLTNAEESIAENQKNGRIIIVTELVNSNIVIQVQDNGVGIPKEIISSIFEPFVTTKVRVKGVGLGLSISYGIVKSHGGKISVTSTVGKGSTFKVTFSMPSGEHHEQ